MVHQMEPSAKQNTTCKMEPFLRQNTANNNNNSAEKLNQKEKHLTVTPYRIELEKPTTSLKKTLKGLDFEVGNLNALDTQVAGHGSVNEGSHGAGLLMHPRGFVLKLVQKPPKGRREVDFYDAINRGASQDDMKLVSLTPKYLGLEVVKQDEGMEEFLVLENVTAGYKHCCVMDVKIGAVNCGPDATEEKKRKADASYRGTKLPFGFSVQGITVTSGEDFKKVKRWNKEFGKKLNSVNIGEMCENFLSCSEYGTKEDSCALAKVFVEKLEEVEELFEKQRKYHFFSSSLLFVYDSSALVEFSKTKDETILRHSICTKMIDFAHVFDAKGVQDFNYLAGVQSLIKLFRQFITNNI